MMVFQPAIYPADKVVSKCAYVHDV